MAYGKLGQQKDAISDLTRAIEINDEYTKAYIKRGELYMA